MLPLVSSKIRKREFGRAIAKRGLYWVGVVRRSTMRQREHSWWEAINQQVKGSMP
jgi:exonuclease III